MGCVTDRFPANAIATILSESDSSQQAEFLFSLAHIRENNEWPAAGWSMQTFYIGRDMPDIQSLVMVEDMLDELLSTIKAERERRQQEKPQ